MFFAATPTVTPTATPTPTTTATPAPTTNATPAPTTTATATPTYTRTHTYPYPTPQDCTSMNHVLQKFNELDVSKTGGLNLQAPH